MYRFILPDFQVVPKPARMSKAKRHLQSATAKRYLENQEALVTYMVSDKNRKKRDGDRFPMSGPCSLGMVYTTRSGRIMDRTNIEKAVEDALVKAGIIVDDSIRYLPDSHRIRVRGAQINYWLGIELTPINLDDDILKGGDKNGD